MKEKCLKTEVIGAVTSGRYAVAQTLHSPIL